MEPTPTYSAFAGVRLIVSGDLETLLRSTKARIDGGESAPILIFEDSTGRQTDFDFRGTVADVLARIPSHPLFAAPPPRSGPGRPKLGVVAREVTLLPRHWEWLESQPGGSSAALRRLVDEGRKREPGKARARALREAASRFMTALAGNLPGYEEATRALFAGDRAAFDREVRDWPEDLRAHLAGYLAEAGRLESAPDPGSEASHVG